MKSLSLLASLTFIESRPHAEPLLVGETGRVLRFALKPRQRIKKHCAPHSPVHIVVLQGQGVFSGNDGLERRVGPADLVVFEAGEVHAVEALDEELVFVAFLHKVKEGAVRTRPRKQPEADAYLTWHM